jgi:hypothetical protein
VEDVWSSNEDDSGEEGIRRTKAIAGESRI